MARHCQEMKEFLLSTDMPEAAAVIGWMRVVELRGLVVFVTCRIIRVDVRIVRITPINKPFFSWAIWKGNNTTPGIGDENGSPRLGSPRIRLILGAHPPSSQLFASSPFVVQKAVYETDICLGLYRPVRGRWVLSFSERSWVSYKPELFFLWFYMLTWYPKQPVLNGCLVKQQFPI